MSSAGTLLLTETARVLGLVEALTTELGGFARRGAVHHPGKAITDLAVMLAAGGQCPADVVMLRARAHLFGKVASDPTLSRIVDDLAGDVDTALAGITAARAHARCVAGQLPGGALPEVDGQVIVDIDATLVTAHSDKELAAPTFKRGFGFHPILAFTAHLAAAEMAYSVGFAGFAAHLRTAIDTVPQAAWTPAVNADGALRDGAWVTEITGLLDLADYPTRMRVIARKERPHPGAQLTVTDVDGHRVTCLATNDTSADLPALEVRHRLRARCEDRIRDAKDTGLARLPYTDANANAIWIQIVLLAIDLTTWAQQLVLTGTWAVASPKTLRIKLFATAARYVRTARQRIIDLDPD